MSTVTFTAEQVEYLRQMLQSKAVDVVALDYGVDGADIEVRDPFMGSGEFVEWSGVVEVLAALPKVQGE